MSFSLSEYTKIDVVWDPSPRWGSLQRSPRSLAGFKGALRGRTGMEGRTRGKEGKRGNGEGRRKGEAGDTALVVGG